MSFQDFPDPKLPHSDDRCHAMTKPTPTYQNWRKVAHRCIRRGTQSRAGVIVCSLHGAMPDIKLWDGTPDQFVPLRGVKAPQ